MPGPRDRILHILKTKGPQTAAAIGRRLGVTAAAAHQHLAKLAREGLVKGRDEPHGVGRPRRVWGTTAAAEARFPDSHGELAVGLLDAVRAAFGREGVDRLLRQRVREQARAYRARMPDDPAGRVRALAAIRREEGYLAEARRHPDGSYTLVENHCPICAAAGSCRGLCEGELELFRRVLGRGMRIERTEHILTGARRCVYSIRPTPSRAETTAGASAPPSTRGGAAGNRPPRGRRAGGSRA